MTDTLAAALKLAPFGLHVFPVHPGAKSPALAGWQQRATSDPAEVERLIGQHAGCNLGVATGERSGVFVLDIDTKGADGPCSLIELELFEGPLPPTWRTDTASGGWHLWFRWRQDRPVGNRAAFRPGLDLRGEGGLVVVPPSSTAAGAYRWGVAPWEQPLADAPDWLLDVLLNSAATVGGRSARVISAASPSALVGSVLGEVRQQAERVCHALPGTRNDTLFKAGAVLGQLVGAGLLRRGYADAALELAAEDCGLVRDDGLEAVRLTINSGLKRGTTQPRLIER